MNKFDLLINDCRIAIEDEATLCIARLIDLELRDHFHKFLNKIKTKVEASCRTNLSAYFSNINLIISEQFSLDLYFSGSEGVTCVLESFSLSDMMCTSDLDLYQYLIDGTSEFYLFSDSLNEFLSEISLLGMSFVARAMPHTYAAINAYRNLSTLPDFSDFCDLWDSLNDILTIISTKSKPVTDTSATLTN